MRRWPVTPCWPAAALRARRSVRARPPFRAGNLDDAVVAYRRAVQADPGNPNYTIALQRAMLAASRAHLDRAKEFEQRDQLEAALGEYRQASEYDPSNRVVLAKVAALEQTIRDRAQAARPIPAIQQLRDRARVASAEPVLNPASRDPLIVRFPSALVQGRARVHLERDRHQHHLRPRRGRRPADLGAARRRHARAGAQSDHDDEPAVVQGRERALDLRVPGHDGQAHAVRRAGHPHVLHLERGPDRAVADAESARPDSRHRRAAADCRQQDEQHDHRARDELRRADHREGHRAERQAARGDRRGHRDPRGRSHADEELRVEPVGLRARRDLFSPVVAPGTDARHDTGHGSRHGRRRTGTVHAAVARSCRRRRST